MLPNGKFVIEIEDLFYYVYYKKNVEGRGVERL